jgi:Secretion system C-terminal sorting domain
MQVPDRSFGRFANGTGNFTEMPTTFAAENQLTSAAGDLPENAAALRVRPNPAKGWARVSTEKHLPEAEIRLLDAQGRWVWSQRFQDFDSTDLPVSGLPPGLYAVCVFSSGGPVGAVKIVVE